MVKNKGRRDKNNIYRSKMRHFVLFVNGMNLERKERRQGHPQMQESVREGED